MRLEEIKHYWQRASEDFPERGRVTPTSRDPFLGQLEERNIMEFLKDHQVALEIGCGDASHTIKYARRVSWISGLDITANLIKVAIERAAGEDVSNIDFTVGSALEMKGLYEPEQFDCIISQRCLINLAEWRYQKETIAQACLLLKRGGLFLLTEGFQDGLDNINIARGKFGLPKIAVVFNRNMICKDFETFAGQYFDIMEVRHYGAYLFLSRVFNPLVVLPDEPKHDSRINEVAMDLSQKVPMPGLDSYSYNLFYALRKK